MNKNADAILLVEDNPDDAELTRLALARHGLDGRVTHVSDGMQALDYLYRRDAFADRTGGNPVLVLLDLKMPLLDGIGVLREIKGSDNLRNIPVVVLTSSTEPSDLQRRHQRLHRQADRVRAVPQCHEARLRVLDQHQPDRTAERGRGCTQLLVRRAELNPA